MTARTYTYQITATPDGWQVANSINGELKSHKRTKTLTGARFYVWRYKRRIKKERRIKS